MKRVSRPLVMTALLSLVLLLGSASSVGAQTGVISGTVNDQQSPPQPVGGITVELYGEGGSHLTSETTDPTLGTYSFTALPAGVYFVRANSDPARDLVGEYYQNENEHDIDLATPIEISGGDQYTGIDFSLSPGGSISGSISGLLGGEDIDLSIYEDVDGGRYRGGTLSTSGSYSIESLPPASYKLWAEPYGTDRAIQWWEGADGFWEADLIVLGENEDLSGIDFTLVEGTSISGLVTLDPDPGDGTIQQIWIDALKESTQEHVISTNVNFDGTYTLTNLPVGSYLLQAQTGDSGYLWEVWVTGADNPAQMPIPDLNLAEPIAVTAATPATGKDFLLIPGDTFGTLRGRVIADDLSGIPDVDVQLWWFDTDNHFLSEQTDASGYFTFTNLHPGSYKIYFNTSWSNIQNDKDFVSSFWADDPEPGIIDPNDLRIDFPTTPDPGTGPGTDLGEFMLDTGGSISGKVNPPDGVDLPDEVWVSAQNFEGWGAHLPGFQADQEGYYHLRGLPAPATYRVLAEAWNTDLVSVFYWEADESTFDHSDRDGGPGGPRLSAGLRYRSLSPPGRVYLRDCPGCSRPFNCARLPGLCRFDQRLPRPRFRWWSEHRRGWHLYDQRVWFLAITASGLMPERVCTPTRHIWTRLRLWRRTTRVGWTSTSRRAAALPARLLNW